MLQSLRRMNFLIIILLLSVSTLSEAFIHPNQLKNKALVVKDPKALAEFSAVDVALGTGLAFHYNVIRPQGVRFRVDTGCFPDNIIPLLGNAMMVFPLHTRLESYLGAGLGVVAVQNNGLSWGLGYQGVAGLVFGINNDTSLFAEYARLYYGVQNHNNENELLKFGLTFTFIPR